MKRSLLVCLVALGCNAPADPLADYHHFTAQLTELLCRRSEACAPSDKALALCLTQPPPDIQPIFDIENQLLDGKMTFHPEYGELCLAVAERSKLCNSFEQFRALSWCFNVATGMRDCVVYSPQPSPTWQKAGESCEGNGLFDPCDDGLTCEGTCGPVHGIGEPCRFDGNCADGLRCVGPIATGTQPTKVCLEMRRVGESCDISADACEPLATCIGGVCVLIGFTAGDPCDDDHPCGDLLYCFQGVCKKRSKLDELCDTASTSCVTGLYCDVHAQSCKRWPDDCPN